MMVFGLDAPGQGAAGLIQDLAGSCQQLHHRPYLPRGFPERILLLLTSLLEVSLPAMTKLQKSLGACCTWSMHR